MKHAKIVVIAAVCSALCGVVGGYAVGQQADGDTVALLEQYIQAESDVEVLARNPTPYVREKNGPSKLIKAYSAAVRNPEVAHLVLISKLQTYKISRGNANSAIQVTQIANETEADMSFLIAAQNQRIIELLEQAGGEKK